MTSMWSPRVSQVVLQPWMLKHGAVVVPRIYRDALFPRKGDIVAMRPTSANRKQFYEWSLGPASQVSGMRGFFEDTAARPGDMLVLQSAAPNVVLATLEPQADPQTKL